MFIPVNLLSRKTLKKQHVIYSATQDIRVEAGKCNRIWTACHFFCPFSDPRCDLKGCLCGTRQCSNSDILKIESHRGRKKQFHIFFQAIKSTATRYDSDWQGICNNWHYSAAMRPAIPWTSGASRGRMKKQ
jgi:hypothetical protein